jgi:RNA recognition motif-containing protein
VRHFDCLLVYSTSLTHALTFYTHTHKHTGYAFIEYGTKKEAEEAIKEMDGESLYEKEVKVDWAFIKGGR